MRQSGGENGKLLTLMSRSLLAQLLMMDKDCWNLVPPMPTTSAISWLTEMMTLGAETQTNPFFR